MGAAMKIRCHTCGTEYSVADEKVSRQSVRVRCRGCGTMLSVAAISPSRQPRQEGSGLIDIRAMAMVLGAGEPAPEPADQAAVSAQPGLGASLPTAGVIMPMAEPARPWWLMPSLAVGGALLVTVVALLAVLLLQPTRASRTKGSDPVPGEAAANGAAPATIASPATIAAPATIASPASPSAPANTTAPTPTFAAKKDARLPRKARLPKRRSRRERKVGVKPMGAPKKLRPAEPHNRPSSIAEILMGVGMVRPDSPKVPPRASLPARLGHRDIQGAMSRVMGAARACGKRFSTSGRVTVRLLIAGTTGRVRGVAPKGSHATSPTGRCVARALRSARFKPFARSTQSLYYTVILR